jgi:hypothetical protein
MQQTALDSYLSKIHYLAKTCGIEIDPMFIEVMNEGLLDLGYERLSMALSRIMKTRKANDRFPSISDIRSAAGEMIDDAKNDHSIATEIADRVYLAIAGGDGFPEATRTKIGEIGWAAIQLLGGLNHLCATTLEENKNTFIAQTRDLIMGLLRKQRAGIDLMALPDAHIGKQEQLSPAVQDALKIASGAVKTESEELKKDTPIKPNEPIYEKEKPNMEKVKLDFANLRKEIKDANPTKSL